MNTTTDITVPNVNDLAAAIAFAINTHDYGAVLIDADGELHAAPRHSTGPGSYWTQTYGPVAEVIDIDDQWDDALAAMAPRDAARSLAEMAIEQGWLREAAHVAAWAANNAQAEVGWAISYGAVKLVNRTENGYFEPVRWYDIWVRRMGRRRAALFMAHIADTAARLNYQNAALRAKGTIK